jgi:ribosomal protein L11 methyltransferase
VLANLISSVLVELAPVLAAEVQPGGSLIASGIFVNREPAVQAALAAAGLEVKRRWAEGDWVAVEASKLS